MENTEKIKLLAKDSLFGVKKLQRIGGSFAVLLPREWVEWSCVEIDGDYYCKMDIADRSLLLSMIAETDLENLDIKGK